jgi:hypothetical protein
MVCLFVEATVKPRVLAGPFNHSLIQSTIRREEKRRIKRREEKRREEKRREEIS